jgi:hypothetical protein
VPAPHVLHVHPHVRSYASCSVHFFFSEVFRKAVGLSRVTVEEEEDKKKAAERELKGRKRINIAGAAERQIGRDWKVKGKRGKVTGRRRHLSFSNMLGLSGHVLQQQSKGGNTVQLRKRVAV